MQETLLVLYSFSITGDSAAFEQTYPRYLPQQEQFPGHLGEMLTRSARDPQSYTIVSTWQADAFPQWLRSSTHDSITAMLDQFGRYGSSVQKYVVVCDATRQVQEHQHVHE